jgi:drug/metabolite transporter (DMT)-like permease
MLDILYTVIIFSGLMVAFKLFAKFGVDNLQAISVNYLVAGVCGIIAMDGEFSFIEAATSSYFLPGIAIGVLFAIVFNAVAFGTQRIGISVTSVANKISLVIPVLGGILIFNEDSDILIFAGITLALVAIYLSTVSKGKLNFEKKYLWILLFIFFTQGAADLIFLIAKYKWVTNEDSASYFAIIFLASGILGAIAVLIKVIRGKTKVRFKNILWGIIVGIPNYFTLHFFFSALKNAPLESSQIYPLVNMGVIVFLAVIGVVLFKEKLSKTNWTGLFLAIIAIGLIAFSKNIFALFG